MQSVLPHRLAQIKSIQLCYNDITIFSRCPNGQRDRQAALHVHRMQQCAVCNLLKWSKLIQQMMTGLRSIEAFVYVWTALEMPASDDPWIAHLLEMQHGANGLRELKIRVVPGPLLGGMDYNPGAEIARFDSLLQRMIKKGAETDGHIQNTKRNGLRYGSI